MEEIQEKELMHEPEKTENSVLDSNQKEGEAVNAPSNELILGKFKSVDELTKAYEKLEKFQGAQAQELGNLRKHSGMLENIQKSWELQQKLTQDKELIQEIVNKYNSPEYFQNPNFQEIFKEAYKILGSNLDAEKFVDLIENYVVSRIYDLDKTRAAQNETEKATNSMMFNQNKSNSLTPPSKRLDEMSPKEVDDLLERLI